LEIPIVSFYHFLAGKKNPATICAGKPIGFLYYTIADE